MDDGVGISHGAILLHVRRVANGPTLKSLQPRAQARKKAHIGVSVTFTVVDWPAVTVMVRVSVM